MRERINNYLNARLYKHLMVMYSVAQCKCTYNVRQNIVDGYPLNILSLSFRTTIQLGGEFFKAPTAASDIKNSCETERSKFEFGKFIGNVFQWNMAVRILNLNCALKLFDLFCF